MKFLQVMIVVALAGCASTPDADVVATLEPCTMPDTTGVPHYTVRGDGFNFCVPQGWVPQRARAANGLDSRMWRNGDQTLTWNIGGTDAGAGGTRVPFTVQRVESGSGGGTPPPPPPPLLNLEQMSETIGGYPATLIIGSSGGVYRTGAAWDSPIPLRLSGEAQNRAEALAQLAAYRTVRFVR